MPDMLRKYHRLRRRYMLATEALAFKGASDPADHEAIEVEYAFAKAQLDYFVLHLLPQTADTDRARKRIERRWAR